MPELDQEFRDAAYASSTEEAVVYLVTLTHPELPVAIRLTNSGMDLVRDGQAYTSVPIDIQAPGQGEDEPRGRLVIPNVDTRIGAAIEMIPGAMQVEIVGVLESDPSIVVGGPYALLELRDVRGDAMMAEGALLYAVFGVEYFPKEAILPAKFLAAFKPLT